MQFAGYLNECIAWVNRAFDTLNSVQGIIIAVVAAALMRGYSQIIGWTIAATVMHEVVSLTWRFLSAGNLVIPDYSDQNVLKLVAIRFVGYFVAISFFYLLRRLFLRG